MDSEEDEDTIELKFTFLEVTKLTAVTFDPQEFRMAFNDTWIANLSAKINIEWKLREQARALLIRSPDVDKLSQLAIQKQSEISKLEQLFLEAESPSDEKRRSLQAFTPVFSANKPESVTIVDLAEKSPSRRIPEVFHLATEQNNQSVRGKSALEGVFDLHETINNDLNQTLFTSCNDDFVAGQLEWQYEEAHSVEPPLAVQASRLKRTIDEMDRVLKSVFEENDDDEASPCRALSPVSKAAPLKVSAKNLTSRKNIDLQSVVVDLLSNERAPVVNFFMQQQQQPSKNPYQVVQIHEAGGQALSKKYENNQERFQRDLNKSLQAPLRPFNTESRNLNSFCVASTSDAGRISLEMKGSLQNTSNGVQLKECQLKRMREVFAGGKFPDELMKEFQRHFQS